MTSTPDLQARKWLNGLARKGGSAGIWALLLPLISGSLLLGQASMLAHVLHLAIAEHRPASVLLLPLLLLGAVLASRVVLNLLGELAASRAGELIKGMLRKNVFAAMLAHQQVWTAARSGGALATLVVEHIEAMDGYLTRYMPAMLQASILPLAFAVVMFPVDWMVGLLLLIAVPLIPLFMALAGWGAEAASRNQAAALSRLSGYFADRLRGITTLKLFGRESAETDGVGRASEALRVRTMRVMRIAFLSSAILEFFAALGVAGVALYVGLTFLHLVNLRGAPLSLEAGLFCLLMAPEVFQPLRLLAAHYHDRAAAKAATTEIEKLMGLLPEIVAPSAAPLAMPRPHPEASEVVLEGVAITTPGGQPVLWNVDLAVAPGTHIAILGASGSGKSTLLEAIAGLRDATGRIAIDGVADPVQRRAGLAMLGQRPTIFAGSVADNIRLARPAACPTAVRRAAERARVTDFAASLPQGLDTELGENGIGLSGGEVQRLALARLYLRDPGLLLLDEPTAHLDAATEDAVMDGLLDFARHRTVIVATHSAAVAARMDHCYRLVNETLLPAPRPALRPQPKRGAA